MSQPSTTHEPDVEIVRQNALARLRRSCEGLILLYDKPLSKVQRLKFESKEALYNAYMSAISSRADFAIQIHLLTVDEIREVMREFQEKRPDIFLKSQL
jgi:hypothetical protein